jgi:hypothetical protein
MTFAVRDLRMSWGRLLYESGVDERLDEHCVKTGKPVAGPIFANSVGHPLDLNAYYQREMKNVLKRAGIVWHGWLGSAEACHRI